MWTLGQRSHQVYPANNKVFNFVVKHFNVNLQMQTINSLCINNYQLLSLFLRCQGAGGCYLQ